MKERDPLLDSVQVAEWLGVSKRLVERKTKSGELPSIKLGGRRLYRPQAVEEFLEDQERQSTPATIKLPEREAG